jgi:urea transporter
LLNSYAQIFFSNSKVFAIVLLCISFFDLGAGLSGVIAVFIGQITALLFNFNKELIKDGTYTYNSVLVGIAIGVFYQFNFSFLVLLFISSILVFLLTIWFSSSLGRKGMPFLSIPFLIAIWLIILGADNFSALALKQKEVFSLAIYFPEVFTNTTNFISKLPFANAIFMYLRSLGAIFFQYNDLAGLFIAIGLLINSRISFVLSIFGFLIGYFFYYYLQGDFSQLIYSYIGFNFILTAIALGGFFVVPSRRSFLLLLLTIPTIALLISGLQTIFTQFNLPLYSLPFNIVVWLFLSAMLVRTKAKGLQLVGIQQFSLEKNHYKYFNSLDRFGSETYFHIGLPVIGKWNISQGYQGDETHKTDWKHALDFTVIDENKKSFKGAGYDLEDYYCYDLPVIAPANGYVVKVLDGIDDNKVGEVDLENNWGNTVIIKHSEFLYSKLSHLKKNAIQVKLNEYVTKGKVLGYCGSSGRSPEPHLHFQMQSTPFIGSKTLSHPISYYLTKNKNRVKFHSFEVPKKNDQIFNVKTTKLLQNVFAFIPGKNLTFEVTTNGKTALVKWEVFTTALNKTYIYCHNTKATAYFVNNGTVFYFTDFYGNKNSFLHYFYLGAHKILLGYYKDIVVKDKLLIDTMFNPFLKAIHDFTAPFYHYCKANYQLNFLSADDEHNPSKISFKTSCEGYFFNKNLKSIQFNFEIEENKITAINIKDKSNIITAKQIS